MKGGFTMQYLTDYEMADIFGGCCFRIKNMYLFIKAMIKRIKLRH